MTTIITRFIGPSNTKGARIVADAGMKRRVYVSFDHAARDPHRVAALALCKKFGWTGTLVEGGRTRLRVRVSRRLRHVRNPQSRLTVYPLTPETERPTMATLELLDCGHTESAHSDVTRGYGTDANGKRYCYDCCTARDLADMKESGRLDAYLSGDGKTITNWPGDTLATVTKETLCDT